MQQEGSGEAQQVQDTLPLLRITLPLECSLTVGMA
jgi:hypothetical protein